MNAAYTLKRVCDLFHHEKHKFVELFIGRVELHFVVVKDELHLEDGQVLDVALVEEVHPALDAAHQQVF